MAAIILLAGAAHAGRCGEFIYNKNGMLRKYEYLNLTFSEKLQKHGWFSTSGVSTEATTAGSDPGVSTGQTKGMSQLSSSRDDCSLFATGSREYRDYIAQNMLEIKKEMALGEGGHLEILAGVHRCSTIGRVMFDRSLQRNLSRFIELETNQAVEFADTLRDVVNGDSSLREQCPIG
jgi:hypothetical protein